MPTRPILVGGRGEPGPLPEPRRLQEQHVEPSPRRYREFVEVALGREVANPLDEVVGSTLLGTAGFVEWAKEKFLKERGADRDLPALRRLSDHPTLEVIRQAAQRELPEDPGRQDVWRRNCATV